AIGQRGELLVGRLGRLRLLGAQLTTGAGQRQPFDENQVLDPEDAFDIGAAVEPRTVGGLRDTEIRELRLPRAEHVRLYLGNLAHLARAKHRAVRNLDGFHGLSPRVCRPKYSSYSCCCRARPRRRTCSRIGVPSKPNDSRNRLTRNRSYEKCS